MSPRRAAAFTATLGVLLCTIARGDDWPMWRYDARRTAATPEQLAEDLRLTWQRQFAPRQQVWDDSLNLDLMTYDRVFEPIVMQGRLLVGFNDQDKLAAFDARTGAKLWTFYAEAPVRLPPAGWRGRVYFCSDDGFLYCVNAQTGQLEWRLRGAPNSQHAIGNRRLTSAWPARGGPVVRDGIVYFAASIWPFMGTFIYAVDAETGDVHWVNDATGSQYIKQPHSAPSFAGVAPQGALVATEELLLVPGGRSVPAVFDRSNGSFRYYEINAGGKGTGGSFVAADDHHFYVHTRQRGTRAFKLSSGVKTAFMPNEPVLAGDLVYSAELVNDRPMVRAYRADHKLLWEIAADGRGDLIRAGNHLYAAGEEAITAIRLPTAAGDRSPPQPSITWSRPVAGHVARLLAADQRLFAVTTSGEILAFGPSDGNRPPAADSRGKPAATETREPLEVSPEAAQVVDQLLASADAQGYAFWFGGKESALVEALAARSPFVQMAVVDSQPEVVDRLRQRLDAAGLYGKITAHHSDPGTFRAPKYVAHMVVVGRELLATADFDLLAALYESVRPYGGVMQLLVNQSERRAVAGEVERLDLEQAQVEIAAQGVIVRRVGALPGSADWTHQYGDIANTVKSNDRRVKLPLGVLWFGGSSNTDVLPRHGHGPPEQVVGGRLFIEGMNSLSARDVYTGRVLWKREFEDLGTFDVYYDATYKDAPLDPRYNQVHIPGANGRGTNYVVTPDRVYIVEGAKCHVLDPATGKTLLEIELPRDAAGERREWGYIGIYKNVLIGGLGFARYGARRQLEFESDRGLTGNRAGFGSKSLDRAASLELVGFDRHTGEQLWRVGAQHSFWHNGIVAGGGRIYCLDKNPQPVEDALRRRGKAFPDTYRILAISARTGKPLWEINEGIFGTWLGYSESKDLLLQAGAAASDRLRVEVAQGMAVYSGRNGQLKWQNETINYSGPCILHNDLIIANANSYRDSAGAFHLESGQPKLVPNPLTGELAPWTLKRTYGCNSIIASENLLTFRSGAAGFYDLLHDSGTGNFGGFKSGCTSNLVVANGVLNAPDYTRTCSCAYQNQTSLALVHMPDMELWTVHATAAISSAGRAIQRLGINFGAAGDRRDAAGLLWLEYPAVAGESPPLSVEFTPAAQFYRQHAAALTGQPLPWVLSSGVEGADEIRIGMQLQNGFSLRTGLPVSDTNDDAQEDEQGQMDLTANNLQLSAASGSRLVGLRFNRLPLPRNAVIRSAHLQFTCAAPSSDLTSLQIAAEDAGNAARFRNDSHDLSRRAATRAEVAWEPPPWTKSGMSAEAQRTPDLTELIRAVTRRPDWQPGNSIVFLISGVGNRVAAARGRGREAKLIIDAEESVNRVNQTAAAAHRVRLFFASPRNTRGGIREFDLQLQDQTVMSNVRLDPTGVDAPKTAVHTFDKVMIGDELRIRFVPHRGTPLLSGVEVVRREAHQE